MKATIAGLGALAALAAEDEGSVIASFPQAVYATLARGLLVLVAPSAHPGPLYLVLDASPPQVDPGTTVRAGLGHLDVGGVGIGLRSAVTWSGRLPPPDQLSGAADLLAAAAGHLAAGSALHGDPSRKRAARARSRLHAGDLAGTVALLAGLGPGLTPAGDDALAGVLLVRRALGGEEAEPALVEVAATAKTTSIAGAFMSWAARGQALSPAHDLLAAAARGDRKACDAACASLAGIGETSGADFALGLTWAMEGAA